MTTVLKNATLFTGENLVEPGALVYREETILYAGPDDPSQWQPVAGQKAQIFDVKGRTLLPGFIDSHIHPAAVAMSSWHIKIPMFQRVEALLSYIKKYADQHPKEEIPFLYFEYYPTEMFDTEGPTKELLDTAVSDRPCLCQDFGEHMHWVNSKMLELMEVDENTPDPVPGLEMFVRDRDGKPTGWVKEMAWLSFAEKMYDKIGWRPMEQVDEQSMGKVLDFFRQKGITAVFDAVVESEEQMALLNHMDQEGRLKVYYDAAVRFRSYEELPEKIRELRAYQSKYSTKHIKLNTMKLFLDGTNEAGNSALLEAHINDPSGTNFGEIKMEQEELKNCFLLCNEENLDIHLHIVGDRAFRTGWKAAEAAKKETASQGKDWNIQIVFAHCELVDPSDMGKPAELGISINWSCHWSGGYFGEEGKNFISREKWDRMYQFNPMIQTGARVAFSSDVVTSYELERADPFFGIQTAHTRIDPQHPLDAARYPNSMRPKAEARIPVKTLLTGYTLTGAQQLRWEDKMGSLQTGKLANLCLVSENPLTADPMHIKDIQVQAVIFEGELLYGSL